MSVVILNHGGDMLMLFPGIPNSKKCENVLTRLAWLQGNERHAIDLHLSRSAPKAAN